MIFWRRNQIFIFWGGQKAESSETKSKDFRKPIVFHLGVDLF